MTTHEQAPGVQEGASRHLYPASAMIGDYLRAAAGLVPAGAIFATMPVAPVPATVLGGFAIVFGIFGLRTALRHNTSIEMTDTEIRAHAEADPSDRLDCPGGGRELDVQVVDPQQVAQWRSICHSGTLTPSASRLAAVASLTCNWRS